VAFWSYFSSFREVQIKFITLFFSEKSLIYILTTIVGEETLTAVGKARKELP